MYLVPGTNIVSLESSHGENYWTITVNGSNVFLYANGDGNQRLNNNSTNSNKLRLTDASGLCSQWTLNEYSYMTFPVSSKGYKLKMKGTDYYVKFRTSGYTETNVVNATLLDSRGTIFKMESDESSGGYRFKWCNEYMKTTGSKSWNSGHGTGTDNATWYIEPVVGENDIYYLKRSNASSGSIFFGNTNGNSEGTYLYTDQSSGNIKWILEEVPLLPETSTSSNPKYYTIENARGCVYAKYNGDAADIALVAGRLESRANVFWFESVAEDNLPTGVMAVKIHNAATDKCVASTNSFTDDGITWYLKANVYEGSASVAINSNSTTWDNNDYGWNNYQGGNAKIANWASNDIGSAWWIEPLSSADWDVVRDYSSELTANIQPFVMEGNTGDGYFQINSTNATSLSTMISEATSDSYVTLAEYTAIRGQLYNNFMKYPVDGGYYRIKNNHYNNYIAYGQPTYNNAGLIATSNSTDAEYVIRFTGTKGTYKLSIQGLNIQQQRNGNKAFPGTVATGVDFKFNISTPGVVSITNEDSNVGGSNDGSLHESTWAKPGIVNWDASANASKWVVEDASDITVKLNNVGDNYYATFCAPFSYTVSEGTKAYTLEIDDAWLVPTEVEGEVAAGTPVLLKGSSATATLTIGSGYAASPLTNTALTGTYLPKTIAGSTDYVLGKYDGKIGFYHWSSNNLGANRAYLAGTTNARGFYINFDDVVTGISSMDDGQWTMDDASIIYNLSGQRLNKMQKGINIVNGKKVLF